MWVIYIAETPHPSSGITCNDMTRIEVRRFKGLLEGQAFDKNEIHTNGALRKNPGSNRSKKTTKTMPGEKRRYIELQLKVRERKSMVRKRILHSKFQAKNIIGYVYLLRHAFRLFQSL